MLPLARNAHGSMNVGLIDMLIFYFVAAHIFSAAFFGALAWGLVRWLQV